MEISLGYAEFIRLLRVSDPKNWVPSLEVREEGVFVRPPSADVDLSSEERSVLSDHPTGDLKEPVLRFPASIENLEKFVDWSGLHGYVNAFDLLKWVKKKAFESAHTEERERAGHYWPIIASIKQIRWQLHQKMQVEQNDSKLVVLRSVVDQLDSAFDGNIGNVTESGGATNVRGTDLVKREKTLLRVIRALVTLAELPGRGAATPVVHQLEQWGFSTPKDDTVAEVIKSAKAQQPE